MRRSLRSLDRRHGVLAGLIAALLLAGALVVTGSDESSAAVPVAAPAIDNPLLTMELPEPPPPPPPPPPAEPARQEPIRPPADPRAAEAEVIVGHIEIPKLGLSVPLRQGITLTQIDRGPSHWPGTAMPGQIGNVVVAGHRVTHTRPFRHIDDLVDGDEVVFTVDGQRWTYVVTGHEVVTPKALWIVDQTPTPTATLFACHPPGSARYRYVVRLALADGQTPFT
jgi:sortase A